jgi:short subunit dehydrogenase-like uncharacterized protein
VLAARNEERVRALAQELGGLDTAVADVARPDTLRDLVGRGDVLVTTVGPFVRFGDTAVESAIAQGAHYVDSAGEPPFIRKVFERCHAPAAEAECGLLTAFGNEWVAGNLAGALALREAGDEAARVEVAYFFTGSGGQASGGTRASTAAVVAESGFAWRSGRITAERAARRVRRFDAEGQRRPAVSVASSEHYALPRLAPGLREVDVYLGWFGAMSRAMQVMSAGTALATRIPGTRRVIDAISRRAAKGSSGGPDAAARAKSGGHYVAAAYDGGGRQLSEVRLDGPNRYTLTGQLLAWAAQTAASGGLLGKGALGPVDGFGLEQLEAGCVEMGLARV